MYVDEMSRGDLDSMFELPLLRSCDERSHRSDPHDSKKARNSHYFKELTVYLSDYDASQRFCDLFKRLSPLTQMKQKCFWYITMTTTLF